MTMTPHQHTLAYSRLASLEQRLNVLDGIEAALRDNVLHVVCTATARGMTVTVAPRLDDGRTLWFYSATRTAIIEADNITDAAVLISGRLRGES